MATLINPEDLIVQYNIPHRDEKAFEGIFGRAVSSAKKIYIPAGDWELSRMLVVSEPVIIEGEGAGISNLIYNGTGPAIVLFFMDGVTTGSGIQNLTIKTDNPQSTTSGVRIDSAELFFVRNTEFIGFNGSGSYGLLAQNSTRNLLLDNVNFSGNDIGINLDAIQGATFKNLSLDNVDCNLQINNSGNILWQGGISKGEAASAGISITDGYSITIEGVEHNLDGYGVYAVETAGTSNQSISVKGCSFYNTSESKNYINLTNVSGGNISDNIFDVSSGDEALSITNSSNLTLGLQDSIYPGSPFISNSGSGFAWAFGETEGSNSGTVDTDELAQVINVKEFGATGDGVTDDLAAIQAAIDSIASTGIQAPIFFPAGTYVVTDSINLPVAVQGLELYGAGKTETSTYATTIRNNNTDGNPLFITSGTGTFSYFNCHDFRMLQSASAGYYFQFDNLTVEAKIHNIHWNMSNTGAGAILMNQVENHLNHIYDCKVVTNGATVPLFHWDGPPTSNITTTTFERLTINSPNSTAPQILVDNKWTTASPGFRFLQINIEQPDGGGIHLNGIAGATFEHCIASDTASLTDAVFMLDRSLTAQSDLQATFIQCHSFLGGATYPDLEIRNTPGTPGVVGPVRLVGGRFTSVKVASFCTAYNFDTTISQFATGHSGIVQELAPRGIIPATSTFTTVVGSVVLANAFSGGFSVNLPPANQATDNKIIVKKTDTSSNIVTVDPDGAETIDGQSNYQLTIQYESITIVSDGTQWFII